MRKIYPAHGGCLIVAEKGDRLNPNGRRRKLVTQMKIEGYSISEVNDTLQKLLAMQRHEIVAIEKSKEATILEISVARSLIKSAKEGKMDCLETLFDRVYGKAKEKVDVTSTTTVTHRSFDTEELRNEVNEKLDDFIKEK